MFHLNFNNQVLLLYINCKEPSEISFPIHSFPTLRHILLKGLDTQNMSILMGTRTRPPTNYQKYLFPSLGLGMELRKWIPLGWIQIELSRIG